MIQSALRCFGLVLSWHAFALLLLQSFWLCVWPLLAQVGVLPFAGNGKKGKVLEAEISVEELNVMRDDNNSDVLARLREDLYAEQLLQAVYWFVTRFRVCVLLCLGCKACHADAACGRMTALRPLSLEDMVHANLSPRFGVEQGACLLHGASYCGVVLCVAASRIEARWHIQNSPNRRHVRFHDQCRHVREREGKL